MSNASLKEQLQAFASQLSDKLESKPSHQQQKPKKKFARVEKPKTQKPKWLEYAQYGVELLRAYFPTTFKLGNETKPLKKGIKQDLILRLSTLPNVTTEDKACMVKSLSYYVNTVSYHRCVLEGAERLDLDGNSAGVVTSEEAKYSIDRQQAKQQAKQARQPNSQSQQKEKENVTA